MAVLIEAYTIIVKLEAIRRFYGDDLRAFTELAPNPTGAADDHLYRLGFMSSEDAYWYIDNVLRPVGLVLRQGDEAIDMTLADQDRGPDLITPWLEISQLAVEGGEVTAAWLVGTEPGPVRVHSRFSYQSYKDLKRHDGEIPLGAVPSTSRPGVLEAFDPESGKMVYSARLYPSRQKGKVWGYSDLGQPEDAMLDRLTANALEVLDFRTPQAQGAKVHTQSATLPELERDLATLQQSLRVLTIPTPRARYTEGLVLMALRRYQEAEMALRRAYALTPNFPGVHQELMASLSYQGKYEEAVEIGRRSVAQWPEDEGVVVNLAIALFRSGSKKEAISLLDDLLVVKPDSEGALEFRRRMIEAMQKPRGLLARLFGRRR